MARGQIENTDLENPELRGVIDFSMLSTGGISIEPIPKRELEFDTSKPEGRLAYEKFMTEPVIIVIHNTDNDNEPPIADVSLNNVKCPIPRNVPVRIPRAFVEVLARSQTRSYRQQRVADPDAAEGMKTKRMTGASFPFRVLRDKNPKGEAWLRRVMHESV